MLKAELKELWGKYCDTDKLVNDVMALLTKYHHNNTEHGVCEMLNTYFTNKRELIELFMKSQNYIGNMRICVNVELDRGIDNTEVCDFCDSFIVEIEAKQSILKYVDEHGKSLMDYTRTGISCFKARKLYNGGIREQLERGRENIQKFYPDGTTRASTDRFNMFLRTLRDFKGNPLPTLSERTARLLNDRNIGCTFVEGTKTSRAFNKAMIQFGMNKHPKYNRLFAQYADMVSGLKRKLKFYISLNPLDYLTMSFGKSWSSCHTIDRLNERNMPNSYSGMHCGGVLSYMLDCTSIITYVHSHATEDHEEGKIYRNMFHYCDGLLVQGRIYPQGNDGSTDLYKTFRGFMHEEFTKLLNLSENAWVRKGSRDGNIISYGVHYRDYECFDGCCITYPKEWPWASVGAIVIGHKRICPNCGHEISDDFNTGMLTHDRC